MSEREPERPNRSAKAWYINIVRGAALGGTLGAAAIPPSSVQAETTDRQTVEAVNPVQQEAMEARTRRVQAIAQLMTTLQPSKVKTIENDQGGISATFQGKTPSLVTPIGQVIEAKNVDNEKITIELGSAVQNAAKEIYNDGNQQVAYIAYNQKMIDSIISAGSNLQKMSLSQIITYVTADKEWDQYQASLQQAGAGIPEAETVFARMSTVDFQIRAVAVGVDQAIEAASME